MRLAGHFHVYHRTCPVYQRNCIGQSTPDGSEPVRAPIHINTGWGGPNSHADFASPLAPYIAKTCSSGMWGFIAITANRTHLVLEPTPVRTL